MSFKTHGMSQTKLYRVWRSMRDRCNNSNHHAYESYGGRGITICNEWNKLFLPFYEWAIAYGYKEGLSIDRINNDKGYEPKNCRWATRSQQQCNRRGNRWVTYNGETLTVSQWARMTGMLVGSICDRLDAGWSDAEAIGTPITEPNRVRHRGAMVTIAELSIATRICKETLILRYRKGLRGKRLIAPVTQHKLTEDDVRDIRRSLAQGVMGERIAEEYGVDPSLIGFIKNGKIWKHVTD